MKAVGSRKEASEQRRRALLPAAPAVAWDELMLCPLQQALEMLSVL